MNMLGILAQDVSFVNCTFKHIFSKEHLQEAGNRWLTEYTVIRDRAGSTVEWKNVESLARGFDFRIQMLISTARDIVPIFWCCSTIFLAHSYLVKQLGRGVLWSESNSWQHLSLFLSLSGVHSPGCSRERPHQHAPAWWRPKAEGKLMKAPTLFKQACACGWRGKQDHLPCAALPASLETAWHGLVLKYPCLGRATVP